jgi:hypothetical protein
MMLRAALYLILGLQITGSSAARCGMILARAVAGIAILPVPYA